MTAPVAAPPPGMIRAYHQAHARDFDQLDYEILLCWAYGHRWHLWSNKLGVRVLGTYRRSWWRTVLTCPCGMSRTDVEDGDRNVQWRKYAPPPDYSLTKVHALSVAEARRVCKVEVGRRARRAAQKAATDEVNAEITAALRAADGRGSDG